MLPEPGVSFVVPVRNGQRWIATVLEAVLQQDSGKRPFEIIVVDDASEDGSRRIVEHDFDDARVRVVTSPGGGAATAINAGLRAARFAFVAQVDQDVILQPGWLEPLVEALRDDAVAAAQGVFAPDPDDSFFPRVMGLDLALRYQTTGTETDHVCTGNVLYRLSAVCDVGLFDESLGYGYDNDMSYRLGAVGFRLVICPVAVSHHRWREGLLGYFAQQYGFGYGRIELIARHRRRWAGDSISPPLMMAHPVILAAALAAGSTAGIAASVGWEWRGMASLAAVLLAALMGERSVAGLRAWLTFGDRAAFSFPVVHLLRDLAWTWAGLRWLARWLSGTPSAPAHSMVPRPDERRRLAEPGRRG